MIAEKTCTSCRLTKPTSEFNKRNGAKDGLQYWCRDCKRKRYEANGVAAREQMRQYYADNADVIKERVSRRYRDGGRPAGMPWPDRPITYNAAHDRVTATYGAASKHTCIKCGEQAHDWAYDHSDPNPSMHKSAGGWAEKPVPYSSEPDRYDPMCRSCHVKRDRYGAA